MTTCCHTQRHSEDQPTHGRGFDSLRPRRQGPDRGCRQGTSTWAVSAKGGKHESQGENVSESGETAWPSCGAGHGGLCRAAGTRADRSCDCSGLGKRDGELAHLLETLPGTDPGGFVGRKRWSEGKRRKFGEIGRAGTRMASRPMSPDSAARQDRRARASHRLDAGPMRPRARERLRRPRQRDAELSTSGTTQRVLAASSRSTSGANGFRKEYAPPAT